MTYHHPTSAAPVPSRRGGAIAALVIGAVLTLGGPVIGFLLGGFSLVPGALDYAERTVELAPAATVELDADESVLLLAPVADLGRADGGRCVARATGGAEAGISDEPASTLNTTAGGVRYESFARVTAVESGPHTLACDTGAPVVAAPPFPLGSFFGSLAWWTAGGLLASLLGVVLVIVGLVRLTRPRGDA